MIKKKEGIPINSISRLQNLANVLLLNASYVGKIGLGKGKLGIAIFFYYYARFRGIELYEEFADRLIDELYEQIDSSIPLGFEEGLTGIGWGIAYLVKNGFLDGDIDEILDEIDIGISDKVNEYLPKERVIKKKESGYYIYQQARGRNKKWNDSEILTFIKPQNDSNMPLSVPDLINPDCYGLFDGIAGEALLILNNLTDRKILISSS